MRSSTTRRSSARACAIVSAIAITTLLSACGSDSDSTSDSTPDATEVATSDAAADTTEVSTVDDGSAAGTATRDDYVAAFATNYAIFDDDEQDQCIGETFVTAIGEDQLASSGLAPGDVTEVVLLADLGLSIEQEALPAAVEDLAACGDLVTISLASSTATEEETACATDIISNELAAEQLLVQVSGLEPSAELLAAREALNGCSAD
jgi:hypothetical protein